MDRFAKFLCDPAKTIKTLAAFAVCVGVVVYVYLQVMGGFDSDISTETALLVSMNETVSADACIFRDETVLGAVENGAVVTLVSEGERVSKGQKIANVYNDVDDTLLQDEINRINRRLQILENSSVDKQFVISDLRQLDDSIDGVFADIYEDSSRGELSSAISSASELLVLLNKRDLIVESDFDFTSELKKLGDEKAELEGRISSVATPVFATEAGYFFGDVDGYEDVFDVSLVEKITLDEFERLKRTDADERLLDGGNVKIVNDFIWHIVCSVDAEQARTLTVGGMYTLSFPENGDYEMSAALSKIVSETNSSVALAVFRVNVLPRDFNYKRFQSAEIIIKGLEGISVPQKALRVLDLDIEGGTERVEGVYILVGDVVRFRSIERIAKKSGYYVAKLKSEGYSYLSPEGEEIFIKPLSLYDNIIVSGKDLFDGKIIG